MLQAQETILPNGSAWRWNKGNNEVSTPNTLWRGAGFNDSSWASSNAPFHYGDGLVGGTLLSDMRSNYTCIFLRVPFVITNVAEISAVQLVVNYDDGFVAWINGAEVARLGVTNATPAYSNTASISHEAGSAEAIGVTNPPSNYLVAGTNLLTVQAFNQSLTTSTDFRFETLLQITKTNLTQPLITNVSPAASATLAALTQVTVFFNKPVSGVDAADLLVGGQPASAVSGPAGTNRYTFTFTQPPPGLVDVGWNEAPGITDIQGAPFDPTAPNATWSYTLTDTGAPVISERTPVSGAFVAHLTQVELFFNEPVFGVNATDLLINGQPATNVTGAEVGPYVFQFVQPAAGQVNFSWAGA
ncbi:MAG: hypothetical protein H7Y43_12270, partial [Akkermansiaceae bacterium]|nr:hypothetical protein [Verrucomicrobiales bacterium]